MEILSIIAVLCILSFLYSWIRNYVTARRQQQANDKRITMEYKEVLSHLPHYYQKIQDAKKYNLSEGKDIDALLMKYYLTPDMIEVVNKQLVINNFQEFKVAADRHVFNLEQKYEILSNSEKLLETIDSTKLIASIREINYVPQLIVAKNSGLLPKVETLAAKYDVKVKALLGIKYQIKLALETKDILILSDLYAEAIELDKIRLKILSDIKNIQDTDRDLIAIAITSKEHLLDKAADLMQYCTTKRYLDHIGLSSEIIRATVIGIETVMQQIEQMRGDYNHIIKLYNEYDARLNAYQGPKIAYETAMSNRGNQTDIPDNTTNDDSLLPIPIVPSVSILDDVSKTPGILN